MWRQPESSLIAPKIFVSYASSDKGFVRRLFARLMAQPLCLWVFESDRGEIPGAEIVTDFLQAMLKEADFVIPVVSQAAFRSRYVRHEVVFCLNRKANSQLRILPLVQAGLDQQPEAWPCEFVPLRDIRYRSVEFDSQSSIEQAVMKICKDVGVDYEPLLPDTFRLPFMQRFLQEIRDNCPRRDDHEISIYNQLMVVLAVFTEAIMTTSFKDALKHIEYFIAICDNEFPNTSFYYPLLVRAVCLLLQDRGDMALEAFESLLQHPKVDESVFGGIGKIKESQSQFGEALKFYSEAYRRDPDDLAAKIGVLTNSVMCKVKPELDLDELARCVDQESRILEQSDIDPRVIKAFISLAKGRPNEALVFLQEVVVEVDVHLVPLTLYAMILDQDFDDQAGAVSVLRAAYERQPDPKLLHYLATYCAFAGYADEAAKYFRRLISTFPNVRRYKVEAAQAVWYAEGIAMGREIASQVFADSMPLPTSLDDFYWDGFGNWILGRFELAQYDFWRSRKVDDLRYDKLFPEVLEFNTK